MRKVWTRSGPGRGDVAGGLFRELAGVEMGGELELFLRGAENEAQAMGFRPALVVNPIFDGTARKQVARRLDATCGRTPALSSG
jgi:hypothetical protein